MNNIVSGTNIYDNTNPDMRVFVRFGDKRMPGDSLTLFPEHSSVYFREYQCLPPGNYLYLGTTEKELGDYLQFESLVNMDIEPS